MPLTPGADVGESIRELHTGKTFARTKKKFGKKRADRQAVAIAIENREKKKRHKKHTKRGHKKTTRR